MNEVSTDHPVSIVIDQALSSSMALAARSRSCRPAPRSCLSSSFRWRALLERLWPPTQRESWSEIRFLHDQALHDPETALILVAREPSHLLGQVPLYLQELHKTTTGDGTPAYESIHAAFESVAREIEAFTAELFRRELTAATSEKALNVQYRQKLLEGLEEVLRELVLDLNAWVACTGSTHLRDAFIEGLRAGWCRSQPHNAGRKKKPGT